ncbi:hypothetical protein [Campylobacter aviculae]|uniref:Uncharacterized protein n=1 Tax=Campylobacter aviculae TaxID=2510190 RepID=A0A4U7BIH6_9BACT|nr:hypothetical protein [Campylobacter aviculae]TKX31623.1 hypothetical protein CQA76_05750 [Campylobacter aviculae]
MTYSFIKPRKKPIFTLFSKIWFGLFSFGIIFIFATYFLYLTKIALVNHSIDKQKQEVVKMQNQTKQNEISYEILSEKSRMAYDINEQNQIIKNSLKNLFDIVVKTGSITLESVEQEKNSLKLTGVTPTREMFALLLETPLKSIFDQSNTTYYRLNNGWYRFVSISKKNSGVLNER